MKPIGRSLVTLGAVLFSVFAYRVPLAGVDPALVELSPTAISPFSLGVTPIVSGLLFVELAALLVPRWARVRHAGPEKRANLDRAAALLAVVLTVVQSVGLVMSMSAMHDDRFEAFGGLRDEIVAGASLVGGTCITALVARAATRFGLVNGFVLLLATDAVHRLAYDVHDTAAPQLIGGAATAIVAVNVVVPLAATWLAIAGSDAVEGGARAGSAYRDASRKLAMRPWIPIPASSAYPLTAAASVVAFPAALAPMFAPVRPLSEWLADSGASSIVRIALVIALGALLSWLFHREREMIDFARRLGAATKEDAKRAWAATLRRALAPTMFFLLAVALSTRVPAGQASLAALPVVAAVLYDLARSARAYARTSNLVTVWEERRPYAVAAIRARLLAEGIESEARGMGALSVLQAFAPYAPVEILVRAPDAERASDLLASLLLGKAKASPSAEEEPAAATTAKPEGRAPVIAPARRTASLGVVAGIALAAFVAAPTLVRPSVPAGAARRASLAIVRVDDANDAFPDPQRIEDDPELPAGVAVFEERLPAGPYGYSTSHYARISLQSGESVEAMIARAEAWLTAHARIANGARLAFEDVFDFDPETQKATLEGVRTFVLTGDPIVTAKDVEEASVGRDPSGIYYVTVKLRSSAAEAFRLATRAAIGRRIAIVIDGRIESAPLVKSEIGGGRVQITMGYGAPDEQLANAKRLAAALVE